MKKMNEKQAAKIREQAKQYLTLKNEGKTAEEIMAQLYMEAFDDESRDAAFELAGRAAVGAADFAKQYKEALQDPERYMIDFQNKMDEGKTNVQKCMYWLKFAASIAAVGANGDSEANAKAYDEMARIVVTEEMATNEMVDHLRSQAREMLKNTNVLANDLQAYAEAVRELEAGDEAARVLLSVNDDENEVRAIATMLAYIMLKKGELKILPADAAIEQVAALMCANHERVKILDAVQAGRLLKEVGEKLLNILSTVLVLVLAAVAFLMGLEFTISFCISFLALPVAAALCVAIYKAMNGGTEEWKKLQNTVVKTGTAMVKMLWKGANAMANYVVKVVLPNAMKAIPQILGNMVSGIRNTVCQEGNMAPNTVVTV